MARRKQKDTLSPQQFSLLLSFAAFLSGLMLGLYGLMSGLYFIPVVELLLAAGYVYFWMQGRQPWPCEICKASRTANLSFTWPP
ncbi:hypothetical protein [Deinococcus sp.]|uniref:hypothetical protein n=1 Tax=Deinococcus sp. TaxID=47478 RepID=UPI003B59C2B3